MAGSSYLKQRGATWYVQLAVPRARQSAVGCKVLLRSLGTRDRAEANRRKHAVLAELQELIGGGPPAPRSVPEREVGDLLRMALEVRQAIEEGADEEMSEAAFDAAVDDYLHQRAKVVGRDEEGNPRLPPDEHAVVRRSYRALSGRLELTLGNRIESYLSEQVERLTAQTVGDKRRRLEDFAQWFGGDREVSEVERADAGRYVAQVIQKRTQKGPDGEPVPLSPVTRRKEVSDLRSFFDWLLARGHISANPFDRMSSTIKASTRGKAPARRPWSPDELGKVMRGVDANDPMWALAAIGAYTGMRREEVGELRVADVSGSVLLVAQGKNASSVRRVPIHPTLAPLIERLAATSTDGYLIPGLLRGGPDRKRSWYVGKRFGRAIRSLGVLDAQLDFHAFRGTVITQLEEAGVPLSTVELIVGHKRKGMTFGVYSGGVSDEVKRAALQALSYGAELDSFVSTAAESVTVRPSAKARKPR